MKVFDLLHSLTPTEKKAFDGVMNIHTREQIKKLYQYVRKTPRHQINNERMYEATYGRAYTKEKDYLLRNELRLLVNELKEMLVKLEIEKELKQNIHTANYWYLKALRARGLNDYYEGEYDKLYQKAQDDLQFFTSSAMSREHMLHVGEGWTAHLDFEKMMQGLEAHRRDLIQYMGNAMRHIDLNHALYTRLSKFIHSPKRKITPFVSITHAVQLDPKDHYSEAMVHMALAYTTHNASKEKHLFKALEHLAHCNKPGIAIQRHLAGCYNSLNLYYLEHNTRDMAKAALYAEKAFETVFPDGPNPSVIYGNYLRTLGQAGMLDKAREAFERYHTAFKNETNYPIILSAYMESEVTQGDPDKAMELLPSLNTKKGINYNSYKIILITAYLRKNLLDLAHTEINNVLQSARENNLSPEMEGFFQLIRTLIRTRMQVTPKQQDLNKLQTSLNAISPQMLAVIRRTIIFMWYYQEALQLLGAHGIAVLQAEVDNDSLRLS